MSKLAVLVSRMEGFGHPGAIPTIRNNPGDLRHAPQESHDGLGPNDIGTFATPEIGWAELERQLQIDAGRNMTLTQFVDTYAPPSENNSQRYLDFLCAGLGVSSDTTVAQALEIA